MSNTTSVGALKSRFEQPNASKKPAPGAGKAKPGSRPVSAVGADGKKPPPPAKPSNLRSRVAKDSPGSRPQSGAALPKPGLSPKAGSPKPLAAKGRSKPALPSKPQLPSKPRSLAKVKGSTVGLKPLASGALKPSAGSAKLPSPKKAAPLASVADVAEPEPTPKPQPPAAKAPAPIREQPEPVVKEEVKEVKKVVKKVVAEPAPAPTPAPEPAAVAKTPPPQPPKRGSSVATIHHPAPASPTADATPAPEERAQARSPPGGARTMQLGRPESSVGESSTDDPEPEPAPAPDMAVTLRRRTAGYENITPMVTEENRSWRRSAQFAETTGAGAAVAQDTLFQAEALFAFDAEDEDELAFSAGDVINVLNDADDVWWLGELNGASAHFPSNYVKRLPTMSTGNPFAPAPAAPASAAAQPEPVAEALYGNDAVPTAAAAAPVAATPVAEALYGNSDAARAPAPAPAVPAPTAEPTYGNTEAPERRDSAAPKVGDMFDNPLAGRGSLYGNLASCPDAVNPFDEPGQGIVLGEAPPSDDEGEGGQALEPPLFGRALYDYSGTSDSELTLKAGEIVEVLSCEEGEAWWSGAIVDREGWFPSSYVELVDDFTVQNLITEYDEDSGDEHEEEVSGKQVRRHVVQEILSTEQDYLGNLEMVIRGYMMPMRPRVGDLFADSTISVIFSNMEQLQNYHARFVADLEQAGEDIGSCFCNHAESFKIYSVYCANHPKAAKELSGLLANDLQIQSFFEGCRLLVEKDIALEGFLLKPVQRICQYPLLLKELVKHTPASHPDFDQTQAALEHMKQMALAINEDKRQKEQLMSLQKSIEGWEGPDITDTCTRLIMDGILTKISGNKVQDRHFFLFDNLFIYCKRTLKGSLQVKGRIATDSFTVIDLKDGEVKQSGKPVSFAFKINNDAKKKWYVLCARSEEEKDCWLEGFLNERKKVQADIAAGVRQVATPVDTEAKNRQTLRRKALQKRFGGQTLRSKRKKPVRS